MSADEVFKYVPLKDNSLEIRLLTILPGEEWSTIQCGIQTIPLHNKKTKKESYCATSYLALYYAWGQSQHERSIILDGKINTVRDTLWTALFYLRSSTHAIKIWIDALCIDQGNVKERNSQVARMGYIYGAAEQVIVWLGLPSEDSYAAFRLLEGTDLLQSKKDSERIVKDWRSVEDICSRPYWTRLWIIQEVIRAVKITVQCGTAVIGWDQLSDGLVRLQNTVAVTNDSKIDILQIVLRLTNYRKQYHQAGCALVELLETFGNSVCFDPRDKIYGLLGLANDCGDGAVVADYNKSTEELFEEVVTFYYRQSLELETSQTSMNWRCPGMVRFAKLLRYLLFGAITPNSNEFRCRGDVSNTDLHFVGFFTGTVGLLGPLFDSARHSPHERSNVLATWYYAIRPHSVEERHRVYESIQNSLTSVFGLDSTYTQRVISIEKPTSSATIGPRAKEAISMPVTGDTHTSRSTGQLGSMRLALVRRKMAIWISLVPQHAQVNDIVATFFDCDVALILLPLGGAHCQILGTAILILCTRDTLGSNEINQYGSGSEEIAFHMDIKTLQLLV